LSLNKATQYYIQNYPRYTVTDTDTPASEVVYWRTSTVNADNETGYVYTITGSLEQPTSVGVFSSINLKYLTAGAIVKFTAPTGFYFDSNNRLVAGIPGPGETTFIWTTVLNVIGDGSNNNQGSFANGAGPIRLSGYVPNDVIVSTIIPVFSNVIPREIIQEAVIRLELNQEFTLVFDNSLTINQLRWSIKKITDPNWFVKFTSLGSNRYTVTYRSLSYYFGSVADTRFTFAKDELVYDPFTGKIIQDNISVLGINTAPSSTSALGKNTEINIVGQTVESDGYVNDFEVEVAATDVNNNQLILNPDFFNEITGYTTGNNNFGIYVFFEIVQDPINLTKQYIIPTSSVRFQYPTKTQIETNKYDYPVGQLFYATSENKFYKTVQDQQVTTIVYNLVEQFNYTVKSGRQGLSYQYKHNSNNTNRIDPATTNIIDLYVVTFSYYEEYQRYIVDTTDTIPEPNRPTITELSSQYTELQDYKMLSDSVILNSVEFKPLFGPKAVPALRATIKVIKDSTTNASDSEIRSAVLAAMDQYFNINNWNFGDTFYFSELSAYLHAECGDLISSAVLVPNDPTMRFGDLYEIKCRPFEIFVNAATSNDVLVIPALTPDELQIR
jgi:hypothetical protein